MKTVLSSKMFVIRDGQDVEVSIDGWVVFSVDVNYGADADGRRGVKRTFAENVIDIMACDSNSENVELSELEKDLAADLLIRKFLEG